MIYADAIFFDVDGTLVDSSVDIINGVNFTRKELGLEEKPDDEIMSYVGTGVRFLIEQSLGGENAELVDKGVELFSNYYTDHAVDNAVLYPHVREILEHFKNKDKYVLTNRYKKFADATLKGLGVREYFKDIIAGDDDNCLKPSACILEDIFKKYKIVKDKAIMVGDMAIDVMMGKNAGIKTCWVTYGLGKRADAEPLKPDYVIDDLIKLKNVIQ